jgi:hypothetical protein
LAFHRSSSVSLSVLRKPPRSLAGLGNTKSLGVAVRCGLALTADRRARFAPVEDQLQGSCQSFAGARGEELIGSREERGASEGGEVALTLPLSGDP